MAPSPPETQGLRLSYLLWSWIEEAGPEPGAPWGPSASCPTSLRLGLQSSAQPAPLWACDCSQVGSWAAAGGHAAGAQRLSPPCSRHPPQGWPRPRGRGPLWPPLEPWTRMWCRAESVRQARSPCDPASGDTQGTHKAWATLQAAGPEGRARPTGHEPRSPAGAAGLAGLGGAAAVVSSGSPHGSWKEQENLCALRRWGGGAPRHLSLMAPRRGGTHPGAKQVAARLLDAADKVPSFCLEQKFAPEESEFRSPMGGGLGLQRGPPSWLPSSSARKALGRVLPRPHPRPAGPAPPAPVHSALAERAVWEAASAEHQRRNGKRAVSRGPQGPHLGNHFACSVQGSSPCSQLCRPP